MRYLRGLCRVMFALTFILSGFFKLIDPVGTGLIVKEYFDFLHLAFLDTVTVEAGMILATIEFTVGISILLGLQMRIFASVAFALTAFFTLLTLYLAIFNPISDCGCFGEAIHLTNRQTFLKNVLLLALIGIIFSGRKKATEIAPPSIQWLFVVLFAGIGFFIAFNAVRNIPQIDFTAYNVGTNISDLYDSNQPQYETRFIYEKDGRRQKFNLDEIPDESWTYIDSETELVSGSTKMAQVDFQLDKTEGPLFVISFYDPDNTDGEALTNAEYFVRKVMMEGGEARVYGPTSDFEYFSDRKSLMTLNRSNGGVVYFNDGVIVQKWSARELDNIDVAAVLSEDPDVIIIKQRIHQQLFVTVLLFGILVLAFLLRYFCRMFSK